LGRIWLCALAVGLLGACDRSSGRLPPTGIAGLDGTYRGEGTIVLGRANCPRDVPYAMTVRNGNVTGEVFSPQDPTVVTGRFQAVIDTEGKIGTKGRVGGDETLIEGYFDVDRFHGSTKSDNCSNRLTLRRIGN
jgi:hypothetical protein